ncbi:metal-independent phosphoserine phosphatase [Aristolochia californica]|uniref:metal-independent phosphoserine phosphatase n=1 Tax=Aristolochia californica TaxID=171875 RepID=UPI0035DF3248
MSTLSFLRNKYWILRHGKSIPNESGLIVSSVEKGILEEYGLAPEGVSQAQLAGELLHKELELTNTPLDTIRICYSPFSRTTQTAKTVANVLNLPFESPQCKVIENLRERYFGPSFELLSHDKYADIWALDEKDPFLPPDGGESVANVVSRLADALESLEAEFEGCTILIVSHGDPLQILQTILHAASQLENINSEDLETRVREVTKHSILSQHRKFALLTGELRPIK